MAEKRHEVGFTQDDRDMLLLVNNNLTHLVKQVDSQGLRLARIEEERVTRADFIAKEVEIDERLAGIEVRMRVQENWRAKTVGMALGAGALANGAIELWHKFWQGK